MDACGTEIYAMRERDSRRYHEPQNAEASGYIYSKRTETVCSREHAGNDPEKLKVSALEHCLRSSFLASWMAYFFRAKVNRRERRSKNLPTAVLSQRDMIMLIGSQLLQTRDIVVAKIMENIKTDKIQEFQYGNKKKLQFVAIL